MKDLSCYDYVPVPYEKVASALKLRESAMLSYDVGPLEVAAPIKIEITGRSEQVSALGDRSIRVDLRWSAARSPNLFPIMQASLWAYPLSSHETQLELTGQYEPPLGPLGAAIDAAVGHRVAQASVLRFVQDLAAELRAELGSPAA